MYGNAHTLLKVIITILGDQSVDRESVMTDMYVYYFKGIAGSAAENSVSKRPATLDAIRGLGDPIMESQLVVDHTELDNDGFLSDCAGMDSRAVNHPTARILSLELRARSRDREASIPKDGADGKDKYLLSLESRVLRKQARSLNAQDADICAHRDNPNWFEGHPDFE
jgi:hypothetical protein